MSSPLHQPNLGAARQDDDDSPQTSPSGVRRVRDPEPEDNAGLKTPPPKRVLKSSTRAPLTPIQPKDVVHELQIAIATYGTIEAAVLSLMSLYDFDIADLHSAIRSEKLDVSFSRARYDQIARFYNLDPSRHMNDAQTFEIARARLPNSVFRRTVEDMNQMIQQYGPPHVQNSEQARSRFLAPLFNNIIARFRELFNNTPEALIEGCITAQGRIEYQFRAFGGVTVVFIEIKLMIGNAQERMNTIAQVLAEGDACDYDNYKRGYHMPIFGILTDGDTFRFFRFQRPESNRCTGSSISVAVGLYGGWKRALTLKRLEDCERPEEFLGSLRPICEVIYSVLVSAFIQSIEAHYQRSLRRTQPGEEKLKSTDNWYNSKALGKRALAIAEDGARVAGTGNISAANQAAERAWELLDESVDMARANYSLGREWSMLSGLGEELFDIP